MNTTENLLKLYQQGLNDYEVASMVHCGRDKLRVWRKEHGIKSKTSKKNLSSDLCPLIADRLKSGESLTAIGKSLDVCRTSITKLLKKNGIKTGFRARPVWTKDYRLTPIQESVLMGEMFGDGGLVRGGPATAYYQCGHSIKQKEFLDWKYEVFSPLSCRRYVDEDRQSITMATWSSRVLYNYWERFYPTGSGDKVLHPSMVSDLDWISMAVWFMGDGTGGKERMNFSVGKKQDLYPIVAAMNRKFGDIFEAKLYQREWHLNIINKGSFYKGIKSYLLPYFLYKIPESLKVSS